MQYVILGLLLLGPQSLYDLHKQFGAGVALFYRASFGSIQRALQQLADRSLISVAKAPDDPRGRKVHTITDAGRIAWREWMLSPVTGSDAETTMLAKVFLLGSLPPEDRARAIDLLQQRVDGDLRSLEGAATAIDAQSVPDEYATVFAYQRATLDYGIRAHRLAGEWLDELAAAPPGAVRG